MLVLYIWDTTGLCLQNELLSLFNSGKLSKPFCGTRANIPEVYLITKRGEPMTIEKCAPICSFLQFRPPVEPLRAVTTARSMLPPIFLPLPLT